MLQKPPEMVIFRDPAEGGLGLISVEARSTANRGGDVLDQDQGSHVRELAHARHRLLQNGAEFRVGSAEYDQRRVLGLFTVQNHHNLRDSKENLPFWADERDDWKPFLGKFHFRDADHDHDFRHRVGERWYSNISRPHA